MYPHVSTCIHMYSGTLTLLGTYIDKGSFVVSIFFYFGLSRIKRNFADTERREMFSPLSIHRVETPINTFRPLQENFKNGRFSTKIPYYSPQFLADLGSPTCRQTEA